VTPQRQLARAACVCVAWRDEASLDEHNQEMLFDVTRPVAHALRRCASAVQTLRASWPAHALPDGVCFPRLVRVVECDSIYDYSSAIRFKAEYSTKVLAALRAAPRLQHWLLEHGYPIAMTTDLVPVVLSHALREAVDAERAACRRLRLHCCIPAVVDAMRGLLPPERDVDVHARFRAVGTHMRPGRRVLERLLNDLPPRETFRWSLWGFAQLKRQEYLENTPTCAYNERQHAYISRRMEALDRAAQTATNITLLHQAVADGSLGAAAVLLRAGADPLRPADDAATGCGSSALALAAAEVSELLAYADRLPHDDAGLGSPLSRLAVRMAPARSAAPCAIAMLWLLGRAAVARHGDAAIAAAMPPAVLAVLRAAPHAVPGLSLGGRVAPFGIARAARALLADAEAYAATGDKAAATRAFRARYARGLAFAALGAAPVALLVAVVVLALAVATTAPLAAFGLPGVALCVVCVAGLCLMFLAACISSAAFTIAELLQGPLKPVVTCVTQVLIALMISLWLFLYPLYWAAELWHRVCLQLISLTGSLFAAVSNVVC
jgi:hypothetical protein